MSRLWRRALLASLIIQVLDAPAVLIAVHHWKWPLMGALVLTFTVGTWIYRTTGDRDA